MHELSGRPGRHRDLDALAMAWFGVDAMFDANSGPNLRVAWTISPETSLANQNVIELDPEADGIIDFQQTNYNDWPYVGFALCKSLVNPLGTTPNPIACGDRPAVTNRTRARIGESRAARARISGTPSRFVLDLGPHLYEPP